MKRLLVFAFFISVVSHVQSQDSLQWDLTKDGGIEWRVKEKDSHMDHIEMGGLYILSIVSYGVDSRKLNQKVDLIFPMLRTIPNHTHDSLAYKINNDTIGKIKVNGKVISEEPNRFYIKGIVAYQSKTAEGVEITHQLFPSTDKPLFIDKHHKPNG